MEVLQKKMSNMRPSFRALGILWVEELSFRIQVVLGTLVLLAALVLHVPTIEFVLLMLIIGTVLAVEALNTAIEEICDHVTPEQHATIGKIKDIAGGATFIMLCIAGVVGLVIFTPYIIQLL